MRKPAALACLGFLLAVPALGQKPPSPALRDRFLREDLALAKTLSLYFVINLKSRTMSLRAGGLTLREWTVAGLRAWGVPQPFEPLAIEMKSTLFPPKRSEIIPTPEEGAGTAPAPAEKADKKKKKAKQKTQVPELEALELKDMPSRFSLFLSDGTRVYFRPRAQKFLARIASFGHSLSWYSWVPLKHLWFRLRKKPFSAIDIKLEGAEDCQSIYWSLAEGAKGLIFPL